MKSFIKHKVSRLASIVILLLLAAMAHGQILDTSSKHHYKPKQAYYNTSNGIKLLQEDSLTIDTNINTVWNYHPLAQQNIGFMDLGQIGTPYQTIKYNFDKTFGFNIDDGIMDIYFYKPISRTYLGEEPLSHIAYTQGTNELIDISVTQTLNFGKRFYSAIDYHRTKNQNVYYSNIVNREEERLVNLMGLRFQNTYFSKDRTYENISNFTWNRNTWLETGGLKDIKKYELLSGRNKERNNDAKLIDAHNMVKNHHFEMLHLYRPKALNKPVKDSSKRYFLSRFDQQFYLKHAYRNDIYHYIDDKVDSNYYPIVKIINISDSNHFSRFINELGYTAKRKNMIFNVELDVNTILFKNKIAGVPKRYTNYLLSTTAIIKSKELGKKQFQINGAYAIAGYNKGDVKLEAEYIVKATTLDVLTKASFHKREPNYFANFYYSSHYLWENNFNKEDRKSAEITFRFNKVIKNLSIELNGQAIKNYIYNNTNGMPKQHSKSIIVSSVELKKQFVVQNFSFTPHYLFQASSNNHVLPLAPHTLKADLAYTNMLFENSLLLKTGFQLFYHDKYYAPEYNPVTRQWQLNNTIKQGAYPTLNFYISGKIKRFYLNGIFEHINAGFSGENYYASLGYPLMPYSIRLRIRWDLYN